MANRQKQGFWQNLGRDIDEGTQALGSEFERVSEQAQQEFTELGSELNGATRKVLGDAEKIAARVAIKGEKVYEDLEVEKRLIGAGAGAKAGFILGVRGGPVGIKVCVAAGVITGAIVGPKGVDKFTAWRDGHKEAASGAKTPNSPADGP